MIRAALLLAMSAPLFGQSEGAPLHFEVASIKPSVEGDLRVRARYDPGRADYTNFSVKLLVQQACEVLGFQVSGPEWMASTRFDIAAKLPAGAARSKVPEMLRSLLAERFHMAAHRETRELPFYALVVGKNGIRMKEADIPAPDGARAPVSVQDCGPTNAPPLRAGWMINQGPGKMQGHGMNMASLANVLGSRLGSVVIDETGLEGAYDFDLEFAPDDAATDTDGESLSKAVQSQLGLKLEKRKGPVEVIVVDRIEKPTAN